MWAELRNMFLAVFGSLSAWAAARNAGAQAERVKAVEAANEKLEEMQDVGSRTPADRDAVLEWMRKR